MNALLIVGGLIAATLLATLITSESAHRTARVDPYRTGADWTLERAFQIGIIPLSIIWIGASLLVLVAS